MPRGPRSFLSSVGGRLFVPLAFTATAVFSVHAVLTFRSAHQHFLDFVRADVERHSDLFKQATHDGMLLNRLGDVQTMIERLADGRQVAAIRFYDKHGKIVLSATRSEIGKTINLDSETCQSCHSEGPIRDAALLERSSLAQLPDGIEVFRQLSVIENEAECANADCHYHAASQRVLGILDVELSMEPFSAAVGAARTRFVWMTVVFILITGFVTAFVIRQVVQRPVHHLREGTQRIARGDLDTRIEVHGGHELAQLSEAFNHMVQELRIARAEVNEWSQTLEDKVLEKTDALRCAQEQVLHMERMASLGKLSASVAHELNNPLAGMLTYARLIRRELQDQSMEPAARLELDKYASVIDKECARCGEIVRNLLTFARRGGSETTRIDLNQIIERALLLLRHHMQMVGVRLQTELPPGECEIIADPDQIEQALVALLVNAVEAMETTAEDRRDLKVRLLVDETEVRIEVEDSGSGIPPEIVPRIFEPFFSTKQQSGAGLGLAVVYGIAHQHGGSIEVETEPGFGTTFRLRLPRVPEATPEEVPGDGQATTSGARRRREPAPEEVRS